MSNNLYCLSESGERHALGVVVELGLEDVVDVVGVGGNIIKDVEPTPPPQGVEYCRRPSHSKFAIRHLSSLVLQVFNPCSLSPFAAASSSSASVVFVCSAVLPSSFLCRSRSRLRSAVVFVRVLRRSRSLGVHRSRSLAVHRSSSRSFGSHVAQLQTLRPTRALHPAVELLSFVVVSSLNPPPDNTLTQHQYSSSNSASSDFYYNKKSALFSVIIG
ncbi:uncharacterized protein LOC127744897 [Arachis duranensis]|uniref:Uncharacterized protein LOC127744897 n=1 Tax=Arachis duranensis TaxID=130453 RepID=A0A9C6TNN7_ARADU|nr:uncharacterized protein LOC127744897 [Arachis duranensis]